MKDTGIVRRLENLGRVVIPIEMRKTMGIDIKDPVEIYSDEDTIIIRKYQESCMFCGAQDNLTEFREKCICADCLQELKELD